MQVEKYFEQNRDAFFPDRDAAAAYAKANCQKQFAPVLLTADAAVEQRFVFQLRWDMEQTKTPVVFNGSIDWLYQPGNDPEFVYAFNRMPFWVCMGQAYALTGDEKYAMAFAAQLVHWVDTVRRDDPACQKAWRTIEAGFRMDYWGKAMCYFEGSPYITQEVMNKFISSMTGHAEYIMANWNSYNLMSNWGVIANRGLFFAGCLLPETERTAVYRQEALRRLDAERRIQIYPDGVQWEQSPMYHNEVFRCLLEMAMPRADTWVTMKKGCLSTGGLFFSSRMF